MSNLEELAPMEMEVPEPKSKRYMRIGGWTLFALFCLLLFTFLKLPDNQIKASIDQSIASFLSERGISYSAGETSLSFLFGVTYTIQDITLTLPSSTKLHIDHVRVSPSVIPLIFGKTAGSVAVQNGKGSLESSFSLKGSTVSLSFQAKSMDLGKLGLLPALAGFQGSAIVDGSGSFSGNWNVPNTLEGKTDIRLKQIVINSQSIMGFAVPQLAISEGAIDFSVNNAKAVIKTFRLGKPSSTAANAEDEIQANVTGDASLGKDWQTSTLNLKAQFSLSESVHQSFVLLDAILAAGKQPNGSYAYTIIGPVTSPIPNPIMQNGNL